MKQKCYSRHSDTVTSRYRAKQQQNFHMYEKLPGLHTIFLVPSTIHLNYWTPGDRLCPVLPLFFTKTSSHVCGLFVPMGLPLTCAYLSVVTYFMRPCGLVYAYQRSGKKHTTPILNMNQTTKCQNPEPFSNYYTIKY